MERRRNRFLVVASVAGVVVMIDQFSKMFVTRAGILQAVSARNPDLALGVVSGPPRSLIVGMILMLVVFLAVVGRWAVQVGISPTIPAVITGGFLANGLDRVRFGAVRDFLPTPVAIIDVADIAVLTGIVALGIALALRVRYLRATSCTITLDARTLRALVVPVPAG